MEDAPKAEEIALAEPLVGTVSTWLAERGLTHDLIAFDHKKVEIIKVQPGDLLRLAKALYDDGFDYLRCQCGVDEGPGAELVSMYHLMRLSENADRPQEVRIKVFLPRDNPRVPSVYWIWKAADWQERESYDMYGIVYEGHPNLIRILMPEDWVGWPMRKDYVTPDFYELQDAY